MTPRYFANAKLGGIKESIMQTRFTILSIMILTAAVVSAPQAVTVKNPPAAAPKATPAKDTQKTAKTPEKSPPAEKAAPVEKPSAVVSAQTSQRGFLLSTHLDVSPPVTEVGDFVGPLMGLHLRAASAGIQWKHIRPFLSADGVYAGGNGKMESYWHAGPGVGISRGFSVVKDWEISPYMSGGFLWGGLSTATASQSWSLPYASGGVGVSWFGISSGKLRSLDMSVGYLHVFSDLVSGYLSARMGVTFGF